METMDAYIGTKIVKASPMHAADAADRGFRVTPGEVEGYHVMYEDGYESWSPASTFDRAYRLVTDAEKALLG